MFLFSLSLRIIVSALILVFPHYFSSKSAIFRATWTTDHISQLFLQTRSWARQLYLKAKRFCFTIVTFKTARIWLLIPYRKWSFVIIRWKRFANFLFSALVSAIIRSPFSYTCQFAGWEIALFPLSRFAKVLIYLLEFGLKLHTLELCFHFLRFFSFEKLLCKEH